MYMLFFISNFFGIRNKKNMKDLIFRAWYIQICTGNTRRLAMLDIHLRLIDLSQHISMMDKEFSKLCRS
jgi:hypothetical protein